ncbi:MAG: hypothetical protein ACE5D6_04605 [Candidatus Zixiibacteriota bacterium]
MKKTNIIRLPITHQEQLDRWLEGESIHKSDTDECCPDFSCCNKKIKTDRKTKELFIRAFKDENHELTNSLLMSFLGKALSTLRSKQKIYISNVKQTTA